VDDEQRRMLGSASAPRRATAKDAAVLAKLFTRAFLADPVMDWIARLGPGRASGMEAFFLRFLDQRMIPLGEVWMRDDGAVAAIWVPPGIPAWPTGVVEQLRVLPLFLRLCGFARMARGAAMSGVMEKAHPHEPHFYLFFIAVDPSFQGKGLGSTMLDANLNHIDAANMPAYLENSNLRNTRLYARAGFEARANISPAGAPSLIPMWRPAGDKSER